MEFKDLENELFDIKVRQEITVAPMREYIENWLKNDLIKITESDQEKKSFNQSSGSIQRNYKIHSI
jgi:hypothetical protein